MHHDHPMPDPFLLILGIIAILCVVLYPLRLWRLKHHRYGNEADVDEELPSPSSDRYH
jgi:hypothetical protein